MSLRCEFCGREFETQDLLARHVQKRHRNGVSLSILERPKRPNDSRQPD